MRAIIPRLISVVASLTTTSVNAQCGHQSETLVRGRFVRCESVRYYWDASGVDRTLQQAFDRAVAETDPQFREELRRRWREQGALPGVRAPKSDFVAVIFVDWQAYTATPLERDVSASSGVELKDRPQEFRETVRYLWRGTADMCKSAPAGSSIDLWITRDCCDQEPGPDGCLMHMNYAETAPRPMSDALSKALDGR